jgi:hypothetical protein
MKPFVRIYDIYGKEHVIRRDSVTHIYQTGEWKKDCCGIDGKRNYLNDETYGTYVCGHGYSIPVQPDIMAAIKFLKL